MDMFTRVSYWVGILTAVVTTLFFISTIPAVGPMAAVMAALSLFLAIDYTQELRNGEGMGVFGSLKRRFGGNA